MHVEVSAIFLASQFLYQFNNASEVVIAHRDVLLAVELEFEVHVLRDYGVALQVLAYFFPLLQPGHLAQHKLQMPVIII